MIELNICKNVKLVSVEIFDAEFILSLRLNEEINQFLSPVNNSLKEQREWILSYKRRELQKKEYYFIIKDLNEKPIGTIRIYNFSDDCFCWGSWIINAPQLKTASIESVLSMYSFAFETLHFKQCFFDVRKENIQVIKFHQLIGAVQYDLDDLNVYLKFEKNRFYIIRDRWKSFFKNHSAMTT